MRVIVRLRHSFRCFVSLPCAFAAASPLRDRGGLAVLVSWATHNASTGQAPPQQSQPTTSSSSSSVGCAFLGRPGEALVGWAGDISETPDSMEISPVFAQCLGLSDGQYVMVSPVTKISVAATVLVEPVSSDDWEILEMNQQFVEDRMLSQVQYVYNNQILPIYVDESSSAIVYLKVVKVAAADVTPPIDGYARMSRDCQVIVAPKPRHLAQSSSFPGTVFSGVVRSLLQPSSESMDSHSDLPSFSVAFLNEPLLPADGMLINVEPFKKKQTSQTQNAIGADSAVSLLRVLHNSQIPHGHISLHFVVFLQLGLHLHEKVRFKTYEKTPSSSLETVLLREVTIQDDESSKVTTKLADELLVASFQDWLHATLSKSTFPIPVASGTIIPVSTKLQPRLLLEIRLQGEDKFFELHSSSIHAATKISSGPPHHLASLFNASHPDLRNTSLGLIGGYTAEINNCVEFLNRSLNLMELPLSRMLPIPQYSGLLITGSEGIGKTMIGNCLAGHFWNSCNSFAYVRVLDCCKMTKMKYDSVKTTLCDAVWDCLCNSPSLLFLDNIDAIACTTSTPEEEGRIFEKQVSNLVHDLLSTVRTQYHWNSFSVIASAASLAVLQPVLQSPSTFNKHIELLPPALHDRTKILACLLGAKHASKDETVDLNQIASLTEGYTARDLTVLVEKAIFNSTKGGTKASKIVLNNSDFTQAQEEYTPISLMGVKPQHSQVSWSDIGGLSTIKQALQETLEWPVKYPDLFNNCPIRMRSGILLYGPPGCGKTMLAQAVASQFHLNFISIKGPELLSKYIGASELAVRDLFRRAVAAKPCVLFFDEFDALAPRRGHDTTGVTDRIVNQLLTQLDGVESLSGVYILAASSRPDLIDPALLRPGRIDFCLFIGFPDALARSEVIKAIVRRFHLAPDVSIDEISSWCEGKTYTPADLNAIIYSAHLQAVNEALSTHQNLTSPTGHFSGDNNGAEFKIISQGNTSDPELMSRIKQLVSCTVSASREPSTFTTASSSLNPVVTRAHVLDAFTNTRPSISPADRAHYDSLYSEFAESRGGNPAPDSAPVKPKKPSSVTRRPQKQTLA
ncbi:Peroxisome biosynthesis protein pex1 [Pelomyxa schiedti]|nr:Peroxisome biosynthesis protein pex1 [Pelomyxa schiedti]